MIGRTLAAVGLVAASLVLASAKSVTVYHNELVEGPVSAQDYAGKASLDGHKLNSTSNSTSYEW